MDNFHIFLLALHNRTLHVCPGDFKIVLWVGIMTSMGSHIGVFLLTSIWNFMKVPVVVLCPVTLRYLSLSLDIYKSLVFAFSRNSQSCLELSMGTKIHNQTFLQCSCTAAPANLQGLGRSLSSA